MAISHITSIPNTIDDEVGSKRSTEVGAHFVGDDSWEDRAYREIAKLREDMLWARIGMGQSVFRWVYAACLVVWIVSTAIILTHASLKAHVHPLDFILTVASFSFLGRPALKHDVYKPGSKAQSDLRDSPPSMLRLKWPGSK
ncbi:hypothetical protein AG1IA_04050 [Rhizoctonia solani AG-1 IA]|uniref:Uncharacterized protein n=1 Tax=Thanatephorus cucumeris (strain AG1-IA) TaxID=983506 RepID=L8WVA5_THACA|nr:hypothetical protein AG1IA_04050 [Rhizoctonia solani AG-1 IA]